MKKTCFITGASSGIGEYLAYEFAKQNYNLVLFARREDRLKTVSQKCREINPNIECMTILGDVTSEADLKNANAQIEKKFGQIDIVIANAGFGVGGRVERLSVADYERQFNVNVYGVLRTVYAFLESLKKSKGTLTIIGSVNGYAAEPRKSAYCMSKFAVRALTQALYYELKPYGIAVTHIVPGIVESEIRKVDNQGKFQADVKDRAPAWVMMPTSKAANLIYKATVKRKKECVITFHGKVIVFLQQYFPWAMGYLFQFTPKPKDPVKA